MTLAEQLAEITKAGPFAVWLRDGSLIRGVHATLNQCWSNTHDMNWDVMTGRIGVYQEHPLDIIAAATPAELAVVDALQEARQ